MEEVIKGLFSFAKEHNEEDIEGVCEDIKEILENYDRRPKDFGMLYRKLDEYIERKESSGDVLYSRETTVRYDKDVKKINIEFKAMYFEEYEIEFKYSYKNKCKLIKLLQGSEDLLKEKECYITFEEAYEMIENIIEGQETLVYKKIGYERKRRDDI